MHGMLSAAILIMVLVLVAVASGGFAGWFFRAGPALSGYSRSPKGAPAGPVADTVVDAPAPPPAPDDFQGHVLALPAVAEPRQLEAPPSAEPPDGESSGGTQIYVLDTSRRSGR